MLLYHYHDDLLFGGVHSHVHRWWQGRRDQGQQWLDVIQLEVECGGGHLHREHGLVLFYFGQ